MTIGAEIVEIVDGKIKEIRDYHRPVPTKAAEETTVSARS